MTSDACGVHMVVGYFVTIIQEQIIEHDMLNKNNLTILGVGLLQILVYISYYRT